MGGWFKRVCVCVLPLVVTRYVSVVLVNVVVVLVVVVVFVFAVESVIKKLVFKNPAINNELPWSSH